MNYEEKYNEILEWARKNKARLNGVPIEEVLPELRESEDESTRKALIETVKCIYDGDTMFLSEQQRDRYLDWLEKQKEQKPNIELIQQSWYMEGYHDREFGKEPKWILKTGEGGPKHELNPKYGQFLQKPAEWSEEDEEMLQSIIKDFRAGKVSTIGQEQWLKSLRPSWKPSEEQMKALQNAVALTACDKELVRLYNQLKKL